MADFILAKGIQVTSMEGIHECYEVIERVHPTDGDMYYSFLINISIDKLRPLLESFIRDLDEPCFFLCETGASQQEEGELRKAASDPLHRNVYYKDGCSRHELLELLKVHGEWFIHDGMSCFGFASHRSKDEIYIGRYKITSLFVRDIERYQVLLDRFDIPKEDDIKTVWKNFSHDTPGHCSLVTIEDKTVYDIIDHLLENGLYLAERRDEV